MKTKIWILSLILGGILLGCQSAKDEKEDISTPPTNTPVNNPNQDKSIHVFYDEFENTNIVLVGRASLITDNDVPNDVDASLIWDFANAFDRELDGQLLDLTSVRDEFPIVMKDQEGNKWDWLGNAVEGPRTGAKLNELNTGMGFWMIFGAMYPRPEIHGTPTLNETIDVQAAEDWGIATDNVVRAAGLNGIPSINAPKFSSYEETSEGGEAPELSDLVVGLNINGEKKAYPHFILDYHEVVNDIVGGVPISLTYCPLTGTAKIYDLSQHASDFFGVSGLLYNSNLMPFDASTSSIWHQLEGRCVNGARMGETLPILSHIETSWESWKMAYPETEILNTDTGFDRPYGIYPYGDYKTNNEFLLSILAFEDDRLERKDRVFAIIINGRAKVYPANSFF